MPAIDESDLQTVIALLHAGETVHVGGSRAHSTLGIGADGWYWLHYDESAEHMTPASEADLRELARRDPSALVPLLRLPHWRALSAALHAGRLEDLRSHLSDWLRWGDALGRGALLAALIDAEARRASADLDALRAALGNGDLDQLYLTTRGGDRGAATAARGQRFADWIEALLGAGAEGLAPLRARIEALARGG